VHSQLQNHLRRECAPKRSLSQNDHVESVIEGIRREYFLYAAVVNKSTLGRGLKSDFTLTSRVACRIFWRSYICAESF
jgi:hypothetical protein